VSVEERLRATTEAVTAAMRPVRPLDLTASRSDARAAVRPSRARPPRRWPGWLVPVAAAAAVIAVAALPVAVRNLSGAGSGKPVTPAATSTAAFPNGAPRYYVVLSHFGISKDGTPAPVRNAFLADAGTGQRLATLNPPSDALFTGTAASADDKTFVLDAVAGPGLGTSGSTHSATSSAVRTSQSHIFFVLRLTPGAAHQAQLTRVPIAASFTHTSIEGLAVSPDGRTLAIIFQADSVDASHKATPGPITLRTYSLATGRELRSWTEPVPSSQGYGIPLGENYDKLSWLGDGRTLAFAYLALAAHAVLRTLRTDSPGTDLIADSRPVFPVPAGCYLPLMTSDGQTVICGAAVADHGCARGQPALTAYSVATGKLERVLYRYQGGDCISLVAQAEWVGSGTLAIGSMVISRPGVPRPSTLYITGVLSSGTFTALPFPLTGGTLGSIAF
jgi:hypothetical protein